MSLTWIAAIVALGIGLALGISVTRGLHGNSHKRFWNTRLGNSAYRRANLPVGGTLAGAVSAVLYAAGRGDAGLVVAALGLGMAAGAIGVGTADPLKPGGSVRGT